MVSKLQTSTSSNHSAKLYENVRCLEAIRRRS